MRPNIIGTSYCKYTDRLRIKSNGELQYLYNTHTANSVGGIFWDEITWGGVHRVLMEEKELNENHNNKLTEEASKRIKDSNPKNFDWSKI
jgi:ribosome biogenesis protein Nip4